jgi:regulatory protein
LDRRTPIERARAYSFLLLKFRLRSERELYERLKRKKFDEDTINATLSFLKEKGFLDDGFFAKSWVNSRLKKNLGLRRIKEELKIKGLSQEIIERELKRIKADYPEAEIVAQILSSKFKKISSEDPLKAKRRKYAYLLRRGFSSEVVLEALNNL